MLSAEAIHQLARFSHLVCGLDTYNPMVLNKQHPSPVRRFQGVLFCCVGQPLALTAEVPGKKLWFHARSEAVSRRQMIRDKKPSSERQMPVYRLRDKGCE